MPAELAQGPADDRTSAPARSWRIAQAVAGAAVAAALVVLLGRQAGAYAVDFAEWVDGLGLWGPVVFMAGYVVATVAFVPGSILTMAAGALFGLVHGTVYVLVAATAGATLAFLIARFLARSRVESLVAGNRKFAAVDRAVGERGVKIAVLLRLSPAFPFNLLNYALGLTRIRTRQFVAACAGMIPGTFLYVYYGTALGSLAAVAAGSAPERGIEQWIFLGVGLAATVAVTAIVTRVARRALEEATDG